MVDWATVAPFIRFAHNSFNGYRFSVFEHIVRGHRRSFNNTLVI